MGLTLTMRDHIAIPQHNPMGIEQVLGVLFPDVLVSISTGFLPDFRYRSIQSIPKSSCRNSQVWFHPRLQLFQRILFRFLPEGFRS